MKASYHTHTFRCHHAVGKEEEYVEKAIAEGISILGFSDHAPMPYENGYVSTYKMHIKEMDSYFSTLLSLKEKYKSRIDIKIGFETEYYPSLWEKSLQAWSPYPLDYLILGQHFVIEEVGVGRSYTGTPSDDEQRLVNYTNAVITAMNTGKISCIAHPDIINYTGNDKGLYIKEMRRLIEEAKRLDIPLEFNLLGMSAIRNYPTPSFWREVAEIQAPVYIGCDAHSPDRVADPEELDMAHSILDSLGIDPIDEMELRSVW